MSKVQLPPNLNPILAGAAAEAATTKSELRVFLRDNKLELLGADKMNKDHTHPLDEGFALWVPDFLVKLKMGLSPSAVTTLLAEKGLTKGPKEQVIVYKDLNSGHVYLRLFEPPPPQPGGPRNQAPQSTYNIPGKWIEISGRTRQELEEREAREAARDASAYGDGARPSAAERLGTAAAKLSHDPRMSQLKTIIQQHIKLQGSDGAPVDPTTLWNEVKAAAQPGPKKHGEVQPSKLSILSWQLAGAMCSKDGVVDWPKAQARAAIIEQSLLSEMERNLDPAHKTLKQISETISKAVSASNANPAKPTSIGDVAFKGELEKLTGGKFVATEAPSIIGTGRNEDALAHRLSVIGEAKSDINYAMWKFYPDEVGTKTSDALAAAAQRGVKVNVIVDGNVASRDAGEQALLKKMRDAGVNVVESKDPENKSNGMHAKMILVDTSKEAIARGLTPIRLATDRNDGTQYLMNKKADDPNNSQFGWSGSDLTFKGAGAAQALAGFARMFNTAAARTGQPQIADSSIPGESDLKTIAPKTSSTQVMSLTDISGPNNPQSISKAIEKLIDGVPAGQTISVDQAYFMGLPGIEEAYKRAIDRGVNIDIVTNSAESCDVPGISTGTTAIFERLANHAKAASIYGGGKLNLYEYTGKQTLHDKVMVFGNDVTMRMSWNQHGRSQELECEDADVIMGKDTAKAMRENIQNVIKNSRLVKSPALSDEERQAAPLLAPLVELA